MPASCPPVNLTADETIEESDTASTGRIVVVDSSQRLVSGDDVSAAGCKRKLVADETRISGSTKRRLVIDGRRTDADDKQTVSGTVV
jgi:hypothetical protein